MSQVGSVADTVFYATLAVWAAMIFANAVVLIGRLRHDDALVRRTLRLWAPIVWLFRLGDSDGSRGRRAG